MERTTTHAKLVAEYKDIMDYTTYVFKLLDPEEIKRLNQSYIMCIRYPNWQCGNVRMETEGYLEVIEVMAGVDNYYDGNKMIPYNYSNVQFIRFIEKTDVQKNSTIVLD